MTEFILTRFVPEPESKLVPRLVPGESPVRILIVAAHPQRSEGRLLDSITEEDFSSLMGSNSLYVAYRWPKDPKSSDIEVELEPRGGSPPYRFEVRYLPNATYETLETVVRGDKQKGITVVGDVRKKGIDPFKPHILHFIGHGKAGRIAFKRPCIQIDADARNKGMGKELVDDADWVDGESLSNVFGPKKEDKPRLIFLNACSGAEPEIKEFYKVENSIARELVCKGIPAVVEMRFKMRDSDAVTFAQSVYEKIGEGMTIGEAVKEGILTLGKGNPSWAHPRFGTPVFFLQAEDDAFLDPESVKRAQEEERREQERKEQSSKWIDCPACGKSIAGDAVWCRHCQTFLVKCSFCGRAKPKEDLHCQYCGDSLRGVEARSEKREPERPLAPAAYVPSGSTTELLPAPAPQATSIPSQPTSVLNVRTSQQ